MSDDLQLWDRLACDDNESWEAFKQYRDMMPHRIRNVVGWPVATVQSWSKANHWEERIRAYDGHLDGMFQREREETLKRGAREITAEHLAILATARQVIDLEFAKILQATQNGGDKPGAVMRPGDVIKLTELVIKMERLSLGETTENVGTNDLDLSSLSDAEFEAYQAIHEKMKAARDAKAGGPSGDAGG